MESVPLRAHLGLYEDETSALCHWHIPEAHFLEAWSDVRSDDGTVTIIQPLIAPLYNGKSAHEVIAALGRPASAPGYELVREYWSRETGLSMQAPRHRPRRRALRRDPAAPAPRPPGAAGAAGPRHGADAARSATAPIAAAPVPQLSPFDREWRKWLHDGLVPEHRVCAAHRGSVQANAGRRRRREPAGRRAGALEVVFRPDPSIYDGRFANNAWLQELPKSLTKLTWDNAALIAPATAARLALVSGDVVELRQGDRTIRIPVWLAPGHAPDTLTLHLGYGRTRAGRAGNGTGFNVNPLRTMAALDTLTGRAAVKTGETYELASTQDHWSLEGRNLVRVATAAQFAEDPQFAQKMEHQPLNRAHDVRRLQVRRLRLGHGDRPERLHRLQRLRRRLPGREQRPGRRQVAGRSTAARCTGCGSTATTPAISRIPTPTTSRCCASSARTRRARWSAPWRRPSTATKA